jgi:hypothetical protein
MPGIHGFLEFTSQAQEPRDLIADTSSCIYSFPLLFLSISLLISSFSHFLFPIVLFLLLIFLYFLLFSFPLSSDSSIYPFYSCWSHLLSLPFLSKLHLEVMKFLPPSFAWCFSYMETSNLRNSASVS